jgi:DNA recombination protein RmuC
VVSQFLPLFAATIGLVIGVLLTWLLTRGRLAAAVEQGKAAVAVDLATANERASRVPTLEAQVAGLLDQQEASQREILRLATSEAEKAQSLQSTAARLAETEQALADTERDLTTVSTALQQSNERRATLDAEAARIPILQGKLGDAERLLAETRQQAADSREASGRINAELKAERDALATLRTDWQAEKSQRVQAEAQVNSLTTELAELTTQRNAERSQSEGNLRLLLEAKEALSNQFKSLANDILEEKAKRFTEQNQTNIGRLLDPLRERITEFKAKVEEIHSKDTEQQATLKAELMQLKDLNRQMTEEAHGLATALKGQAKKQGNWGELVLGNVLDRSGLREGKDFRREVSFNTEEGRKRPDVVIYLPQAKHLVIDAKVSLNAYTRYVNAEDDLVRQQALQEHVSAVASRIQELSNRVYFDLPGLNSPEMVFMFIPIESAFVEALRADESLFQKAIEQNVLVATPTTLLTSLNIVRQLWRFEEQNAHTAELADRAGKVYKKLVTFLGSMEAVGKQLDKAKESFGTAMGQLYTGKGNLIGQAKEFEKLGVSVQTPLPEHLVAKAALELEHLPETADDTQLETIEQ